MSQAALACQLPADRNLPVSRDPRARRAVVLGPRLVAPGAADRYVQLDLRRRRAQIAARHALDVAPEVAEDLNAGAQPRYR